MFACFFRYDIASKAHSNCFFNSRASLYQFFIQYFSIGLKKSLSSFAMSTSEADFFLTSDQDPGETEELEPSRNIKLPPGLKNLKEKIESQGLAITAESIASLNSEEKQKAFSCLSNFFRDGRVDADAKSEYRAVANTPEQRWQYMAQLLSTEALPGKKVSSYSHKTSESMVGYWKTLSQLKGPLCFNSDEDAETYAANAEWKLHDEPSLAAAGVRVYRYVDNFVSRVNTREKVAKESNQKHTSETGSSGICVMFCMWLV